MCGIAGRYNFVSGAPVDAATVTEMCDLVAHRGPDGAGVSVDGPVGFGHRRLAIIDLSDAGRQPMTRDALSVTFNGEIYNYRELKRELAGLGHRFQTETDTEVLLAAWQEWGSHAVDHLHGMFAFALWDAAGRTFWLVRDRLGKKPLYYWTDRDGLAFASEPKAFLADPGFTARPNLEAIHHYLSLQYVPTPLSAFAGVHRVPPGHLLRIANGQLTVDRYWSLSYEPKAAIDEPTALAELRRQLEAAVSKRLVSDVPLGAFLSGGIDSGVIVALMAGLSTAPVRTFSIGFHEARYNELPWARMVADRYGTEHHEFVVTPDAVALLPKLVWHYNEPYADSSAVPTWCLAEVTRQSVTVALNGDGGDEAFAGYDRYRASVIAGRLDRLPRPIRALASAIARRSPAPSTMPRFGRARRFLEGLGVDASVRYASWMMHFATPAKRRLCTPEFLASAGARESEALLTDRFAESTAEAWVDRLLDVDVQTYLPDDLLVKVDIATMAHGLEARSPFLDHDLLAFAARLPVSMKLRGGTQKYLLRRLARELLPPALVNRPKMGFGVPIDVWFRRDLRDMAHDVLLGSAARSRGYFNMGVVEQYLAEHESGRRSRHAQLWNLLMLELWHQTFVDRPAATITTTP
ncbi:MAG TPA: asparagine synthase (glutamine-hydrolyzing) [Vicinamibacterales bacterium]|nr:asparagine synthase (glutamine-hydrolyzing) [Vicinamibacterales bacterium]